MCLVVLVILWPRYMDERPENKALQVKEGDCLLSLHQCLLEAQPRKSLKQNEIGWGQRQEGEENAGHSLCVWPARCIHLSQLS